MTSVIAGMEYARTETALAEEVRALIRRRSTLVDEIDLLRAESQQLVRESSNFERFVTSNRRFFSRALEREIYRTAREAHGRFSTLVLQAPAPLPAWFVGFLTQSTRVSDLCVRSGATDFLIFLHGAGGLGRRVFRSRFARNLAIAGHHHAAKLRVALGAASYPHDGETPGALLRTASARLAPVDLAHDPAPAPPPSGDFALAPPDGALQETPPRPVPRVVGSLVDACEKSASGEVVIRSGDVVGRVYLCDGLVAWAHCSSHAVSLTQHLVGSCGADPKELRFAYEYCKTSGSNFAETLIEFGTFERTEMRTVLAQHLRSHLEAAVHLEAPDVLFLPQSRRYHSDLLFTLSDLLPSEQIESPRPPTTQSYARDTIVAALAKT